MAKLDNPVTEMQSLPARVGSEREPRGTEQGEGCVAEGDRRALHLIGTSKKESCGEKLHDLKGVLVREKQQMLLEWQR